MGLASPPKMSGTATVKYADDTYIVIPAANVSSRCAELDNVGSRVIVLLFNFFEYFVQLAYSCTHLFSDISHLLSTAPPPLEPVRSTRGRCEAYELRAVCISFYRRDTRSTTS